MGRLREQLQSTNAPRTAAALIQLEKALGDLLRAADADLEACDGYHDEKVDMMADIGGALSEVLETVQFAARTNLYTKKYDRRKP